MTPTETSPVNSRLICSIAACLVATSTSCWSLHRGQSSHPRPEPVSRTAAPVTTMMHSSARATTVIRRYVAGAMPSRRILVNALRTRCTARQATARPDGGPAARRALPCRTCSTSYDDFPLHQASVPIALTATSDANHYDRYFFNGMTA